LALSAPCGAGLFAVAVCVSSVCVYVEDPTHTTSASGSNIGGQGMSETKIVMLSISLSHYWAVSHERRTGNVLIYSTSLFLSCRDPDIRNYCLS